jgi:hypothetical protein
MSIDSTTRPPAQAPAGSSGASSAADAAPGATRSIADTRSAWAPATGIAVPPMWRGERLVVGEVS